MNNTEHPALPNFRKYILMRWPNWRLNEMEVADWCATLQKYPENVIARTMFLYGERYELGFSPSRKKFAEIAGQLVKLWKAEKEKAENQKSTMHNPEFWVVCQETGIMKPLFGRKSGELYPKEQREKDAERWHNAHNQGRDFQGNHWFVLHSTDLYESSKYPNQRFPVNQALPKQEPQKQEQPVYADAEFFEQENEMLKDEEPPATDEIDSSIPF